MAKVGRKKRKQKYTPAVFSAVRMIWEVLDFPCGARLQPMLTEMYQVLVRHKEIMVNNEIEEQLKTISSSTLDRRLKREREIRHLWSTKMVLHFKKKPGHDLQGHSA